VKGFVKAQRKVCKDEWAWEAALIIDSQANLDAYNGSPVQDEMRVLFLPEFKELAVGDIYWGNRVYDEM